MSGTLKQAKHSDGSHACHLQSYLRTCVPVDIFPEPSTEAFCEDGTGGVVLSQVLDCTGPFDNVVNVFGQLACVVDDECYKVLQPKAQKQ